MFPKLTDNEKRARLLNVLKILKNEGVSFKELPSEEDNQILIDFCMPSNPEIGNLIGKIYIDDKLIVAVDKSKDVSKMIK